jgi:hypothetical protein
VADNFHDSGGSSELPSDNSAHISTHNAVAFRYPDSGQEKSDRTILHVRRHAKGAFGPRLDESYNKALQRAEKRKDTTRTGARSTIVSSFNSILNQVV